MTLRALLYPLGLLASCLFFGRFFVQWIGSERKKQSHVTPIFWILSLAANGLLALHAFIQLQFPILLIQTINGTIAWRNLDLMRARPRSLKRVLFLMGTLVGGATLLFLTQGFHWMRAPTLPWTGKHATACSLPWHILGFIGLTLFASRFWIQWWLAEKHQESTLGRSFWWLSLSGGLLSLVYFVRLLDPVNMLGYGLGLIPYVRNLMLFRPTPKAPKSDALFMFAGEASGDDLGEGLIRELGERQIFGVGGPKMRAAGIKPLLNMEDFQVMGFSDVFKALPRLVGQFRKIKKEILRERPKGVVLIDYPDFNMFLARALRKSGYTGKVIHYVSPSVWAWRKGRVKGLAKTLDRLLTILPFEEKYYEGSGLPISYVGHPLVKAIPEPSEKKDPHLIALFPGSRRHEVEANLPLQLASVKPLLGTHRVAISVARPELEKLIRELTPCKATFVPGHERYALMEKASAAIATSGTVNLELALHNTPTIVTYQLTPLNYYLGRYAFRIRLPYYCLVNIILQEEVFPEFYHRELNAGEIGTALKKLLQDPETCVKKCQRVRAQLQARDASHLAAQAVLEEVE